MFHRSDSWPLISGDVPAGVTTKMRYLAQCLSQNYAHHVGGDVSALPTITLALPDIDEAEQDASTESAPSRFYCEVFWRSLPWKAIRRELGAVNILELGCGSGNRFRMFSRVFGSSLAHYVGVDIRRRPAWTEIEREDGRVRFVQSHAESLPEQLLQSANLIVSQSVLEHVQEDRAFFQAHAAVLERTGGPVVQIHLVPATASLFLYLWHGYRQYSRTSLSRLVSGYKNTLSTVAPIGGTRSNLLHMFTITLPVVCGLPQLRQFRPTLYRSLLRRCYLRERGKCATRPAFYALLVQSGIPGEALWQ